MILTKLALHNFGIYGGKHEIDLTVQKDKPIILVGALNGSGKTTLLESNFFLFPPASLLLLLKSRRVSLLLLSSQTRHVMLHLEFQKQKQHILIFLKTQSIEKI